MSSEITYRIFSLCQGWRECDASFLLYLSDIGRKAKLPYFFWLLVPNNDKSSPVLVDTGFMEGHYKNRYLDYNDTYLSKEALPLLNSSKVLSS